MVPETSANIELPPLPDGMYCLDCGYDLRGSTSARCPECGFALELLRTGESQIPWAHRREMGRFRAYWKTVWLVTRWPKRFCSEIARPVSYRGSQSFRWLTVLHAYPPVFIAAAIWGLADHLRGLGGGEVMWWVLGGLLVWSLLVLAGLPGFASYFFQPRRLSVEQQNRAIALSYYAWAPLAITPAALVPFIAAVCLWRPFGTAYTDVLWVLAGVTYYLALVFSFGRLGTFAKHMLPQSPGRRFLRMAVLGLLSVGLAALFALLPVCVFWLLVIYYSLR